MTQIKANETNSTSFEPGNNYTVSNMDVDITRLRSHPSNTYEMDSEKIESLAENIEKVGLLQPLYLRVVDDGGLQILAGHRRHAALLKLLKKDEKWRFAPARVAKGMSDVDALFILHSANIFRPVSREEHVKKSKELEEEVKNLRQFHPEWKGVRTDKIIANMLGIPERTYRQKTQFAKKLIPDLYELLENNLLTTRIAESLSHQPEEKQKEVSTFLKKKKPKDKKESKVLIEAYEKSTADYLSEFNTAIKNLDAAYFQLVDSMKRTKQISLADVERAKEVNQKLRKFLNEIDNNQTYSYYVADISE